MASPIHFDVEVTEETINENGIKALKEIRPSWDPSKIKMKTLNGGITNRLEAFYYGEKFGEDTFVLRMHGEKTELIIDREAERVNMLLLAEKGLCPPLYVTFTNGLFYGFAQGVPLSNQTCQEKEVRRLIAKQMVSFQNSKIPSKDQTSGWSNKVDSWFKVLPDGYDDPVKQERFQKEIKPRADLEKEKKIVEEHLSSMTCPIVFCHNDLLMENIIYDKDSGKITFIDHEYGMFNYQAYDIGNHFCEYAGVSEVDYNLYPKKEYQIEWLKDYLQEWNQAMKITEPITDKQLETLYVDVQRCAAAAHFFWGIWALIQSKYSAIDFDYLSYAVIRLNEYFRRKDEFFSLQYP